MAPQVRLEIDAALRERRPVLAVEDDLERCKALRALHARQGRVANAYVPPEMLDRVAQAGLESMGRGEAEIDGGPGFVLAVLGRIGVVPEDRRVPPEHVRAGRDEQAGPAERPLEFAERLEGVAGCQLDPGLRTRAEDVEGDEAAADRGADIRGPGVLEVQRGEKKRRPAAGGLDRHDELGRAEAPVDPVGGRLVAAVAREREQVRVEACRIERPVQVAGREPPHNARGLGGAHLLDADPRRHQRGDWPPGLPGRGPRRVVGLADRVLAAAHSACASAASWPFRIEFVRAAEIRGLDVRETQGRG